MKQVVSSNRLGRLKVELLVVLYQRAEVVARRNVALSMLRLIVWAKEEQGSMGMQDTVQWACVS